MNLVLWALPPASYRALYSEIRHSGQGLSLLRTSGPPGFRPDCINYFPQDIAVSDI
jgi:hypothetical protein